MTAQVRGQKTIEGLRRLSAGIAEASHLILAAAVAAAETNAKATTLWKDQTGGTRGSIKGTAIGSVGKVEARGAASLLEGGTRAHTIAASSGSTLRFFVNGQSVFRRVVHHPGTAARPFMHQARDHAARVVEYAAEIYVAEAIARA